MGDVTPFLVSSLLSDCPFRSKTSFLSQSFASFCLPQTGFTLTFKVLLFSIGGKKTKILTGNLLSQIFFAYFIHMILYIEISKYVYVNGREKKNNELTFHQLKKLKCLPLSWWQPGKYYGKCEYRVVFLIETASASMKSNQFALA